MFTFSSGEQAGAANGSAVPRYAMIISVQKLTQMINQIQQDSYEYRDTTGKY